MPPVSLHNNIACGRLPWDVAHILGIIMRVGCHRRCARPPASGSCLATPTAQPRPAHELQVHLPRLAAPHPAAEAGHAVLQRRVLRQPGPHQLEGAGHVRQGVGGRPACPSGVGGWRGKAGLTSPAMTATGRWRGLFVATSPHPQTASSLLLVTPDFPTPSLVADVGGLCGTPDTVHAFDDTRNPRELSLQQCWRLENLWTDIPPSHAPQRDCPVGWPLPGAGRATAFRVWFRMLSASCAAFISRTRRAFARKPARRVRSSRTLTTTQARAAAPTPAQATAPPSGAGRRACGDRVLLTSLGGGECRCALGCLPTAGPPPPQI